MGNAIISRRGGGYATVKFENYGTLPLPTRSTPAVLSQARDPAATTSGDYALFGGGTSSTSIPFFKSAVVDVYSGSLAKTTVTSLSQARCELAATTVGSYALFGGGYSSYYFSTVDTYNSSLTKGTATSLSQSRSQLVAAAVGSYALFGSGYNNGSYFSTVDAYNSSLTRSTPTTLSESKYNLAATTVGNYALFGGGYKETSSGYIKDKCSSVVNAYNSNLSRLTPTGLSEARYSLAATKVGDYALFGGGNNLNCSNVVDAYNNNLTRSTVTTLSVSREKLGATSAGGYALFGGGVNYSSYYSNVDAYKNNLVRSTATSLSKARCPAATTVGNYALFGGGDISSDTAPATKGNTVDAYKGNTSNLKLNVYKGSKYKFQNMSSEVIVTSNIEEISIPIPVTGYIKTKNTSIS